MNQNDVHQPKPLLPTTGFTLSELLITVALVGILAAGAVPSMANLIANNRMASQTNTFLTALNLARSEAVKRGVKTVVCPSVNGEDCAGSTNWHTGLIVFVDLDGNDDRNGDDPLLQVLYPHRDVRMTTTNGRTFVRIQPSGTTGGTNLTMQFCPSSPRTPPQVVCISNTGRARLLETRCDGTPIACR